jgi:hypothetical protein
MKPVSSLPVVGLTPRRAAERNRAAFAGPADALAAGVVTDRSLAVFRPGKAMSQFARWYTDDDAELLIAVVAPTELLTSVDEVLAFGLAWQQDRDLLLVLSPEHCRLVLPRLAWVGTPVRVWEYDDTFLPRPTPVPSRAEVLVAVRKGQPVRPRERYQLSPTHSDWLESLLNSEVLGGLTRHEQKGYLSWHSRGLQVLRVARSHGGLELLAGVRYSKPTPDMPPVLPPIRINAALSGDQLSQITAAITAAVADGGRSLTSDQLEHRLQASLEASGRQALDLRHLSREYPAHRGHGRPGFVDFLAADARGALHVVETKIGHDPRVVLQALDYGIWVAAHEAQVRQDTGWDGPSDGNLRLDLVLAPKLPSATKVSSGAPSRTIPAVNPYIAPQLEALAGDVKWRVFTVADASADDLVIRALSREALWTPDPGRVAKAVRPPRWSARLEEALRKPQSDTAPRPKMHTVSDDAILPLARHVYADVASRGLLHRFALHVRSSQAFAFNVFGPLQDDGLRNVWRKLGHGVSSVELPQFEWEDTQDRLAEASSARPHRTQVDVLLRARDITGRRLAALIEVKLTEPDFGGCSALAAPANSDRGTCTHEGLFGGNPDHCFQLGNHGHGRRQYDTYLGHLELEAPTGRDNGGGCWLRTGRSQPMRNLALAQMLIKDDEADAVVYALCAPTGYRTIWRRFSEFAALFPDPRDRTVIALPAEVVAAEHPDGGTAIKAVYPSPALVML